MDSSPSGSFILILVLVLINAFFASAEMAIVSLNKTRISLLAEDGNKKALLLQRLLKEPSNFLATIQVGITFAGFFASASAATSISGSFAKVLSEMNIPYSENIALIVITILLSYITLVFGELLPKRVALQNAEKIAMFSVQPIIFISKLTNPFVLFLSYSTNVIMRLFGIRTEGIEEKVSREEIKNLIEIGEEQGAINETERNMIDSIIEFDDKLAKEVMTPRTETFLLEVHSNLKDNINRILEENFSRIPVYENDIDNVVGVLYIKDLFASIVSLGIENVKIKDIMRTPYFVPETKNIDDLFKELQSTQNYLAILIDEYGGFSGIVTIEDLIEEVMGEISDEFDDEDPEIQKIDDKTYIVSGLVTIDDLNDNLNLDLSSDSADSIGGLCMELLGTVPKEHEHHEIELDSLIFKILQLDEKRIEKLQLTLK
ncbi:putative hemolysin [Clostridium collagenovorans DSM 3089]|uniref:Putative hemolysin n=1 Tax=Clostridium collagenovorans DSM 3089 TaxID=1121306 RepID=A0A1M5WT56_9CLOT|nr:hemolysin family protein [Clostridium collagenovorans]SHH90213.1 putative hemolysin [Clostridium collagenovorans DSM 3089]